MSIKVTDPDNLYSEHLQQITAGYLQAAQDQGASAVLISSGSLKGCFLDDHHYPFVVNPHFKALAPVTDVPDSFILLRAGEQPAMLLSQPEDYWHKPASTPDAPWTRDWQIHAVTSLEDAHNLVGNGQDMLFIGEETELARQLGIQQVNQASFLNQVHFSRAYKTDYELRVMQIANEIAVRGHLAAEAAWLGGESEFGIAHHYLGATGHREQQAPYSAIVALNENCAVLHYQHYEMQPPAEIRSMLIDAGASYRGYAADITRTYTSTRGPFADLLAAMEREQLAIISDIRTGDNYADLHEKMHYRLAHILRDAGIMNCSPDEMIERNLTFSFLPHGLGHLLGLQTHDVGGFQQNPAGDTQAAPDKYPALRLTRPIEERQVFTIEPGLYFIPMLLRQLKASADADKVDWALVESLIPFGGIRIEDNIAIIDGKTVNLTRDAFAAAGTGQ